MEVPNPSALFLADRRDDVSGAVVFAGMEGTRPVLVEIQALVAPSPFGTPRRAVIGWDSGRLAMVTAVLEARCGLEFTGRDVFLNVAGGLKITEPAADLAVAAALVSSLTGAASAADTVVFGEIGLSAEVRAEGQTESRLKEAAKLGFTRAIMPARRKSKNAGAGLNAGLQIEEIGQVSTLADKFLAAENGASVRRLAKPH
jgi:DNA repair protein RadA/Sms